MALTIDNYDELTNLTLAQLQKGKVSQIAQTYQDYPVMSQWFDDTKIREQLQGGYQIEKRILNRLPGAARMVTVDQTDNPFIPRLTDKIQIPWRMFETHYAWFIETDILMNDGPSEIVDMLEMRRTACKVEQAEFMENKAWTAPSASQSPAIDPFGVPYYVVTDTSQTDGAQTTALPGSWTSVAGLVPASTPGWTNWAAVYTNVTQQDFIKKVRRAMDNTGFKSPVKRGEGKEAAKWVLYCGEETKLLIEDAAVDQNENLGPDVASMDGMTTIRGNRIQRVNPLDSASLTPFYGINHNTFGIKVLKGAFFREDPPQRMPSNLARGRVVNINTTFNFYCDDRRRNFVVHKAA